MINVEHMTENELRQLNKTIIGEINYRRDQKNQQAKSKFKVGDDVKFNGRNGVPVEGRITKINPKTIVIDAGFRGSWKVSPSILEVR